MATKPYFLWGDTHAASDSDVRIIRSSALETASAPAAAATAPTTDTAALVSPELGAAAVARPRLRRDSSVSEKKKKQQQQQQQAGGGVAGAKKPPQRGLGVAELERLRCGGDPLLELSAVVGDAAGARVHPLLGLSAVVGDAAAAGAQGHGQGHPLLHYHHHHRHHLQMPAAASAFAAVAPGARYCSQLVAPAPGPVCVLHHPPAAAGCQRAPPPVAPEQQFFRDRWSRMGVFSSAGGGADHQSQSPLLPVTMAPPEHPSSQSTIWGPAVSSSSCLHTGHRCDICSRRMRALTENGGPLAPTPPDYSIYDLATAMATARQGDAFLAGRERKQGAAEDEAPAKKDVREIEFFPAASAHHTGGGGRVSVPGELELAAPFSSPYGYGAAASHTAPQLDLSLRL